MTNASRLVSGKLGWDGDDLEPVAGEVLHLELVEGGLHRDLEGPCRFFSVFFGRVEGTHREGLVGANCAHSSLTEEYAPLAHLDDAEAGAFDQVAVLGGGEGL